MATVKTSGGDYSELKAAIDAAETTISIEGTWSALPAETNNILWDTAGVTVTCDSDSQWDPSKPRTGGTYHYALYGGSADAHVITATVGGTLEGIELKLTSSSNSNECIRHNHTGTFTHRKMLIWTAGGANAQDGIYAAYNQATSTTLNVENCQICNCVRAGIQYQKWTTNSGQTTEINVNSCTIFNCNLEDNSGAYYGGISSGNNSFGTTRCDFNVFNCVICNNDGASGNGYDLNHVSAPGTLTVDRTVYGNEQGSWGFTDSEASVAITDTTSQGASYVYVEEDDTAPYDLRLSGDDGDCEAIDRHADGTGAGLTMPSDDIMGTSRPQNTDYDLGLHEFAAAGTTTTAAPTTTTTAAPTTTTAAPGVTVPVLDEGMLVGGLQPLSGGIE